jgi:hypothetical protein
MMINTEGKDMYQTKQGKLIILFPRTYQMRCCRLVYVSRKKKHNQISTEGEKAFNAKKIAKETIIS